MYERVIEASGVTLATLVVTALVVSAPVLAGAVIPYVTFPFANAIELLRIGAPFLLFFLMIHLATRGE